MGSRCRRRETKYLLKRIASGIVPDEIIHKPKVGFFNAAVDSWFRSQIDGAVSDYLLAPSPRYSEFLDRREIERLVQLHREGEYEPQSPASVGVSCSRCG